MDKYKRVLNVNIAGCDELTTPEDMKKQMPVEEATLNNVLLARQTIQNILDGRDDRYLFVVGPCSIHDPKAALEYAGRLKELAEKVQDRIFMVMRVYFEKPRTTVGWKGLINDPRLDDSFHIEEGIKVARQLLLDINALGLPTGTEALDPISPQYVSELMSWSAIGARTTESQTHREMSSGLSMPVGFKNGTDGGITVAVNAMQSVVHPHHFLGINELGKVCKFSTRGNPYSHVVLRGGTKPNYDAASIEACVKTLTENDLRTKVMVDCSHANSNKDHSKQPGVLTDCVEQIKGGNKDIFGFMIESNLEAGNQKLTKDLSALQYGVSVTDKCVDWKTTEEMILKACSNL
jgi:3-deoxy-7-phosphoheptulonate synthase